MGWAMWWLLGGIFGHVGPGATDDLPSAIEIDRLGCGGGFRCRAGGQGEWMQCTLRECFDATPEAVPQARHLLTRVVSRDCPNASEIHDAVALTVSEAVGNVVRHAYPDDGPGLVEVFGAGAGHVVGDLGA